MRVRRGPLLAAILVGAAVAGLGGELLAPYRGFPAGDTAEVVIPAGAGAEEVSRLLQQAGVIRSPAVFRALIRLTGTSKRLQAGEYSFHGAASALQVHRRLVRGDVILHRVTVREGLRLDEVVDLLAANGLGEREALARAAADPSPIRELDPEADDLEGYLFPETYLIPRDLPPAELMATMVDRFREVFGPEEVRRAAELGLTVRQVVTLASLVEKETARDEERPLVASVFHNRLHRGMLLQCDPTVIYGLVREGRYDGRLTRQALQSDTPYNTYVHPGLPPGPIASPGEKSIQATLYPSDSDYLYFVSRNDGSHEFSRRLEDHERAVDRFQRSGRSR